MNKKRVISFILAFLMLLGTFVNPVFAISSNPNRGEEAKHEIQEIDGKTYKVYKISDLGLKNPEKLLTPKYRTRAAGDPMEDWVKLLVQSNTVGLTLGDDFNVEVYVALRKDSTKIAVAKINPKKEIVENEYFYFVKTAEFDENNPDHQDPEKWYLYVEDNFKYDIRLGYGEQGNFGDENMTMTINQRAVPLYKAVWFTNNQQRPVVDAFYNDGNNRANPVKLNTEDFAENEYKSFSSEKMPFYVAHKEMIVKEENLGTVPADDFLVSDMKGAVLWKLLIDQNGEKKTKGFVEDRDTTYHFNITGDFKTPFVATMREELKVKFDPNGATFDQAVKAEQPIGHSMKIGEAFGDLEAVTVPAKNQISNIPQKDNKDQEFVGWVIDPDNKDLDFSNGQNADKLVDPNGYEVKKNVTFYAVYAPVAQGRVAVQYVDKSGTAILDKYKIKDEDYPAFAEGSKGKPVEASKIKEPKFIGYKRTADTIADAINNKTYKTEQIETVEVKYEKLPDIIPEDKASDDVKNTYTKVTFAAEKGKGTLKIGSTDGGNEKVYYVNPVEGKTIAQVKDLDNITAEGNEGKYKVHETTPWTFVPDEVSSLETVITTVPVTVNANFVKEKGTVKYEYKYENSTEITDPSKDGIPAAPTDAKEYDVETLVTAGTTVAKDMTVPVKDNSGTIIGNWTFSGWTPAKLDITKGENKFTGTWTFTEAGKKDITFEFASGTPGATLPDEVKNLLTLKTKTGQYVNSSVDAPTETYNAVEITEGDNAGTWTFDGWYAKEVKDSNKNAKLTVTEEGPNKFIGNWTFVKAKGTVTYVYEYKNETSIADPSKDGIPAAPTDATEYEVGTTVKALNNIATDKKVEQGKTVPVKDNSGTTIGNWTFGGWNPAELKVKKNSQTVKNEFKGTWTFTEAGKHGITYKFEDKNGNALPAQSDELNKFPDVPTDKNTYYEGQNIPLPTTPAVGTTVKGTMNNEQGTWKFLGWYKGNAKLTDATIKAAEENEIVGKWEFEEAGKGYIQFEFKAKSGTLPTEVTNIEKALNEGLKNKKYYVDEKVTPGELTTTKVKGSNGKDAAGNDVMGEWETTWTPSEISINQGENKVVVEWEFKEAQKAKISYKFLIQPGVVPNEYDLSKAPFKSLENTLEPKEGYVGYKVTAPNINQSIEEEITFKDGDKEVKKKGFWTFVGWSSKTKVVSEDPDKNQFVGTWTWGEPKPEPTPQPQPTPGYNPFWPIYFGSTKTEAKPEPKHLERHEEYIAGYPDGTVRPDGKITRAEVAAIFARLTENSAPANYSPKFSDVRAYDWFSDSVMKLSKKDIIKGYPDGTFKPNKSITRAEFAVIASKYIKNPKAADETFSDVPMNHWAKDAIAMVKAEGWISGYTDGTFKPDAPITRAEAVSIVNRMFDRAADGEFVREHGFEIKKFNDLTDKHWAYYEIMEAVHTHDYERIDKRTERWDKIVK